MSALTTRDSNARPNLSPQTANTDSTKTINEKPNTTEPSNVAEGEENNPFNTNIGLGGGMRGQMLGQKKQIGVGNGGLSNVGGTGGAAYVSPSDAIQSPASRKLADFKQRQMNKSTARKPAARTLFARTVSTCSSGVDEAEENQDEEKN